MSDLYWLTDEQVDAATRRLLDEYLVVAARTGDQRAFADLVCRWHRRLLAHAWRLTGDDEAARDAVQSGSLSSPSHHVFDDQTRTLARHAGWL